ncbi:MAG: hypothetical protein AAF721_38350 [Myxococcota bacterium]
MEPVASVLRRFGGVIAAPRATAAALRSSEGHHDGLLLGALYVFAIGTFALIESAAGIFATRDLNAVIMLASVLGRMLVAPILVLVAAETILGAGRGHRRGLSLVPMVLAGVVGHELAALGVRLPMYGPEIAGAAWGLFIAWRIRDVVPALDDGGTKKKRGKKRGGGKA